MTLYSLSPAITRTRRPSFFHRNARFARAPAESAEFANGPRHTRSPRERLAIGAFFLALLTLLTPFAQPGGAFVSVSYGKDGLLAIDSPDFSPDTLAATDDGFIMKRGGQTTEVDRSELSDIVAYTVESGDSLAGIANNFGVSMETIIWENNIANPSRLKVGTTLNILPVSGIAHTVGKNETLAGIAKKYGVTTEKLAQQNRLAADAKLSADQKIIIPGGKRIAPAVPKNNYIAGAGSRKKINVDGAVIEANGVKSTAGRWMVKPVNGIYTQYFRAGHYAVDIGNRSAPGISAAAGGTITQSQCGWNGGYGCMIVIDHGNGFQTLYAHLSKLYVSPGEKVAQGQSIGKMGSTGRVYGATGIHLHFEVVDHGRKRNPLAYF